MENTMNHTIRELQPTDIPHLIHYWLDADADYMRSMGVDLTKMPSREQWEQMLTAQLAQDYPEKQAYAIIWELDGQPVGHSNVNKITFGEEAFMHLHIWEPEHRKNGNGLAFMEMTIPMFFKNLKLKRLYCEPYALNPAPNRILPKLGFRLIKSYITTPGWINFEQEVHLWMLEK